MQRTLVAVAMLVALGVPASAQLNPQQQRMTDCNAQAKGMTGDARQQFMSSCLSNKPAAEAKKPNCGAILYGLRAPPLTPCSASGREVKRQGSRLRRHIGGDFHPFGCDEHLDGAPRGDCARCSL